MWESSYQSISRFLNRRWMSFCHKNSNLPFSINHGFSVFFFVFLYFQAFFSLFCVVRRLYFYSGCCYHHISRIFICECERWTTAYTKKIIQPNRPITIRRSKQQPMNWFSPFWRISDLTFFFHRTTLNQTKPIKFIQDKDNKNNQHQRKENKKHRENVEKQF